MSHQLTWSHYFELLKCDNKLELQFYYKECIKEGWKVRELKRQMVCQPDDNPPIGIVLGARKDELLMEYAMEGITNQLFVARYQLYLPKREELQAQLDQLLDGMEK